MAEYVPYDDSKHHSQFKEINIEYITWFRDELLANYNIDLYTGRQSVREYVENTLSEFIDAKPPEARAHCN